MNICENLEKSKHFVTYIDPESGVKSYIFQNESVKHTQSFYFTNPSASNDGRYLWMYCAFPPAGNALFGRSLGVVDLVNDTFTHYPETMFFDASPIVDVYTGDAYFLNQIGLFRKSPDPEKPLEHLVKLPDFLIGKGYLSNMATHMTFSPDRKRLCFDAYVGSRWIFGDIDLEKKEFVPWYTFTDFRKNHAQYNPKIPDLMLIAEDDWSELENGTFHPIRYDKNGKLQRLWLLEKGKEPVYIPPLYTEARHEWWSADGKSIYYVDWDYGTIRYDLNTKEYTVINPRGTWHAHSTVDDTAFVADENEIDGTKWYRGCKSRVHYYNAITKKHVNIVTENPALFVREDPCRYHIDPHPQFTVDDTMVMYTATVTGRVSAAICDVEQLKQKTQ